MIKTKDTFQIKYEELEFINQGQDHAVFRHKGNQSISDQFVVKIKKNRDLELESSPEKNKKFFYSEDIGDCISTVWFTQMHDFEFRGLFADMHYDFQVDIDPKNIQQLSLDFKGDDAFLSTQHSLLTFSKNLYYSHKSSNRKLVQFFVEFKPKCVLRQQISIKGLKQVLPNIKLITPEQRDVYKTWRKYYRKLSIHRILRKKSALLNFFDKKHFKETVKNFMDTKFCIFSTNTESLGKLKAEELMKNLKLSEKDFLELMYRCFFFKHNFYGHKMNSPDVLQRFQSLFPYPWYLLEPYMSSLAKVNTSEKLIKDIFSDLKQHIVENRRYKKGDLNNPEEVLKAVIFALVSNVFSDCSLILDVLSFPSKTESVAFCAENETYQPLCFHGRYFAFKMNAIDLEMKRLWKIQEYINKEKTFFTNIFKNCKDMGQEAGIQSDIKA